MDKNTRFWGFQCNGQKHWAEVCFGGEHYRHYTKIHNIPKRIIVPPFLPYFILLSAKSLLFSVIFCKINTLAQAQYALHWNFSLCNVEAPKTLYPNNHGHYTEIALCVMSLSIKIK